jgi:hypothetical protein
LPLEWDRCGAVWPSERVTEDPQRSKPAARFA